ncbi:hypothetical protein [Aquibium microcysteis]|uniref:hypothetical protein n=1 Tax=Aquibium microcysteis TaxID=675281 RepID=UPI00165D14EC|nr:hypothetical protein [Aquibium microcysteis]
MMGTFVNRGTLGAGVVALGLIAGAVGLAGPAARDCLSAAAMQPAGRAEPVRAKVRPAYATQTVGSTVDGATQPRARNRPVSATSGDATAAATNAPHRSRSRPVSASAAKDVLPDRAAAACA